MTTPAAPPKPRRRPAVPRTVVAANQSVKAASVRQPSDYQKILAAEFILAELLVAATPMTSRKGPTDVSPYVPRDMTKLLAIGGVYFLLMLAAIPSGWGKPAAWFGALILLAVGLNEAANVANDIDALAGITNTAKKTAKKATSTLGSSLG